MIPKLHYVSEGTTPQEQLAYIQKACSSGAELIRLSTKGIASKKVATLAKEARSITAHFQTRLILENQVALAKNLKADGVFLTKGSVTEARNSLHSWQTIGVRVTTLQACEDTLKMPVDYLVLYPFKIKEDHVVTPPPLGIKGCTLISEALQTETPLLVEGNIDLSDVTAILDTGISGIAVASVITQDFNMIKRFNELLGASATQEQRHTFK